MTTHDTLIAEGPSTPSTVASFAEAPWDRSERRTLVRLLLLIQGATAVLTAIEAAVIGLGFGAPFPSGGAILTALGAAWWLTWARSVGHAGPRSLRWLVASEILVVIGAAVDLVLAVWLAGRLLEPVALTTQVVVPLTVVGLVRTERRPATAKPKEEVR